MDTKERDFHYLVGLCLIKGCREELGADLVHNLWSFISSRPGALSHLSSQCVVSTREAFHESCWMIKLSAFTVTLLHLCTPDQMFLEAMSVIFVNKSAHLSQNNERQGSCL